MRIQDLQKSLRILEFPQGIFSDEDLSGKKADFVGSGTLKEDAEDFLKWKS